MNQELLFNLMVAELKELCKGPPEFVEGILLINKVSSPSELSAEIAKLMILIRSLDRPDKNLNRDLLRISAVVAGYTEVMTRFIDNVDLHEALKKMDL